MQLHMICRLRAHVVEWRVYRESGLERRRRWKRWSLFFVGNG